MTVASRLYCPVRDGKVYPGIRARGLHGSWRLVNGDYTAPEESVVQGLQDMQPEDFELMLIEVQIGEL